MSLTVIPEVIVPGKRLGRHLDERTTSLRDGAPPPPLAPAVISVHHPSGPGMPFNQGEIGSCTGNALCGALNTQPHWATGGPTLNEKNAVHVYSEEQQDLFGTPYPPTDQGGSGQAVCEAAIQLGWCDGFQVAAGINETLLALVLRPVITGINWYTSFDECDPTTGIVTIAKGATVRGGHEIVATQIDATNELAWFWQSWGRQFGLNNTGRFAMSFDTWETLLNQGGDVVVPRTSQNWVAPTA